MRKPIIAGNWKMHTTVEEALELVKAMLPGLQAVPQVESVVCPPFVSLHPLAGLLRGTGIGLGAQNMFWEEKGAYTGEISPLMLKGLCQYVIIGHSERRTYFGETDEGVNRKVRAALAHGLTPIVCVGENLVQNEAGETDRVVSAQVRAAYAGLDAEAARKTIIRYRRAGRPGHLAGHPRHAGRDVRSGYGAGHPHPVRRKHQRPQHPRVHDLSRHRRRPGRRGQPQSGRVCGNGAHRRPGQVRHLTQPATIFLVYTCRRDASSSDGERRPIF